MENASKALIMAAGILIGIIIITIGVYVFITFGGRSQEIQKQIDERVLAEFNNNFIKYEASTKITIHDIVSLANFAKKNNKDFEFSKNDVKKPYYIEVYIEDPNINKNQRELTFIEDYTEIINKNSMAVKSYNSETKKEETHIKYYYTSKIIYNEENRVKKIIFKIVPNQEIQ